MVWDIMAVTVRSKEQMGEDMHGYNLGVARQENQCGSFKEEGTGKWTT